MCLICNDQGRTGSVVHGIWVIKPCSCNNKGDWETTRKPFLEKILKEAEVKNREYLKRMGKMA